MAKKRIFTVGFELPGDDFEYVPFESVQTLLDADIVLIEPTFGPISFEGTYNGKSTLSHSSSFAVVERQAHWKCEITEAIKAGKMVVVYLVEPEVYNRFTGQQSFSGTGRNQRTTNYVEKVSSYNSIPSVTKVIAKKGVNVRLDQNAGYFSKYWNEFSAESPYCAEIEGDFTQRLLFAGAGDRTIGAVVRSGVGAMLLIPPIDINDNNFVVEKNGDECWTSDALKFGKRLASALVALFDSIINKVAETPQPDWVQTDEYRLAIENKLNADLVSCLAELDELRTRKSEIEQSIKSAGRLRGLLFEQGHTLELLILEALKTFGFKAENFDEGDSEFDAVFISAEGRCIGEAEGKDNKPINIDKFSQLERNVGEDYCRECVTEHAKAVLFGNAYRLLPLEKRGDFFTEKCKSAAKRIGAALVRTPDLFEPVRYLREHPQDEEYAEQCRLAIISTQGSVVEFPKPSISDMVVVSE